MRQEEGASLSARARAGASTQGGARWLVSLAGHAATFWVQLVVARLGALLAFGCGDDEPQASGVLAPVCRQLRRWKTRLSVRL